MIILIRTTLKKLILFLKTLKFKIRKQRHLFILDPELRKIFITLNKEKVADLRDLTREFFLNNGPNNRMAMNVDRR